MSLNVKFKNNYSADGIYTVHMPGYELAKLYWADETGRLQGWTSFGNIKLDAESGFGVFEYQGRRAIPPAADYICLRASRSDSSDFREELFPIEIKREKAYISEKATLRLGILTDIHLTRKTGAVKSALQNVSDSDCILLLGDIANSGSEEEFKLFEGCLDEAAPNIPVFSVNGNHDLMGKAGQYEDFKDRRIFLQSEHENICYSAFKGMDIIGINAGGFWQKDIMKITKEQLSCLDVLLKKSRGKRKIILCHTPLSRNMPVRNGRRSTYLSRDEQLQKIIDSHNNIIFLSGHTHLSPCLDSGAVYFDSERCNIYINCGSIRPTELGLEAEFAPKQWKEGNTTELKITEDFVEVFMQNVRSKSLISRGYYMICFK